MAELHANYKLATVLTLVLVVSLENVESSLAEFYPCLKPMENLKNDTRSSILPLKLQETLSLEVLKMEPYVAPILSVDGLCDYIQKRVLVIFGRIYGWKPVEDSNLFANNSGNASTMLHVLSILSTEYLISGVIELRRKLCVKRHGIFKVEEFACVFPKPKDERETSMGAGEVGMPLVAILGNVASIIALLLLLILFSKVKNLHAPQKCIIFLAITQELFHILQLASLYLHNRAQACTIISIALHWIDLSVFVWLCCASYEANWMLSGKSAFTKQERLTGYGSFAYGLTAVIVLSCTITHFSSEDSIRYGHGRYCIIGNKLSNVYSFVLPISVAFLFSAAWTFHNYRKITSTPNRSHLHTNEPYSLTRGRLSVAIRVTLLSVVILCSRLLEAFWRPSELAMSICKLLISLQGIAIFFGVAASRDVLRSIKTTWYGKRQDRVTFAYKYRKRINLENNNT